MSKRIIIVGGVAGGASCAARLRRLDETAEILLFERGEYISFANCGLPYYIGGVIPKREHLLVQSEETMSKWFNLQIFSQTEVVSVAPNEKTVIVKDLRTGSTRTEKYDTLVLSPGAAPIVPPLPGIDDAKERVFTLRNIADVDAIKSFIDTQAPKRIAVVGGGFIGMEMIENLRHLKLEVHLIEATGQVMAPFDPEMVTLMHAELMKNNVGLHFSTALERFEENGKRLCLSDGTTLDVDCTILAIGVRPESHLIQDAGIPVGKRGGILVDDQFKVIGAENIYAIGDAIEVRDLIFQEPTQIPLAGPANRQGRMLADILCGRDKHYKGTLGSSIVRIFTMTGACTGKNEKQLKAMNTPYLAMHLYPANHATYYPDGAQMSLKVLYAPETGKLYGAQAVGAGIGIDKTIDIIATAIHAGLSIYDLADLELCYAPPFSTAKAPVNFAGYIAENIANGEKYFDDIQQIDKLADEGIYILNVSTKKEHEKGHLPNAINIPLHELREHLDELPKNQPIYVHCAIGVRGHNACRILQNNGFDAINVAGGLKLYRQSKV